jgi:hypothetical protein
MRGEAGLDRENRARSEGAQDRTQVFAIDLAKIPVHHQVFVVLSRELC